MRFHQILYIYYHINIICCNILFQSSHFIHCVKPNADILVRKFDECMILRQLRSSSTLAYVNFVRFGFPLRIAVTKMNSLYASYYGTYADARKFHMKLLLAIGLRIGEFKIGQNYIHFRSNQRDKLEQILSVDSSIVALKRYIARTRWLILLMMFIKFARKGKEDIFSTHISIFFNWLCLLFRKFQWA